MASRKEHRPALASLLDRLSDEDPDRRDEQPLTTRQLEKALREAIRRDIESFLNARRRPLPIPETLELTKDSILDYGIPDFIGQSLRSDRQRSRFLSEVIECIKRHEPRFKSVSLQQTGNVDEANRSLRFRIDATVYAEPVPEHLSFDSEIELSSRTFDVQGGRA